MVEYLIQKARMRACVSDSVAIERIEQWNARGGTLEYDKFEMNTGPLSFSNLTARSLTRRDRGSVLNSVMCTIGIERGRPFESKTQRDPVPSRAYPMPWDMYEMKA